MATPAVQPGRVQPGGPLVQPGSPGTTVAPATFIAYTQPAAATVLPDDLAITDIEPAKATVLQ